MRDKGHAWFSKGYRQAMGTASVRLWTNIGFFDFELFFRDFPRACFNFVKLCKLGYYNWSIFLRLEAGFLIQGGDPSNTGKGGESIWSLLKKASGDSTPGHRFFEDEINLKALNHARKGTLSMASAGKNKNAAQFFMTLADGLDFLDGQSTCFGRLLAFTPIKDLFEKKQWPGDDVFALLNEFIMVDAQQRPFQDVFIVKTEVLMDPFPDSAELNQLINRSKMQAVDKSAYLKQRRTGAEELVVEEELHKKRTDQEIEEERREREAAGNALVLEILGDLPQAGIKPPENVLFVCKLNAITRSSDLELIFSRFGRIASCEVIKDRDTGRSLGYAFVEFEEKAACEQAFRKMDNVLVDDRRIRVDFSQSVSKLHGEWARKREHQLRRAGQGSREHSRRSRSRSPRR